MILIRRMTLPFHESVLLIHGGAESRKPRLMGHDCLARACVWLMRQSSAVKILNPTYINFIEDGKKIPYANRVELFIWFSNDLAFHESIALLSIYNCHVANALPMNQTKNTARPSTSTAEKKNNFDITYFNECRFSNHTQTITSTSNIISWPLENELNKNQTFEFKWDWIITKLTIC